MEKECCKNETSNAGKESSNWKQYVLLAGVGIVLMFSIVQAFQINALQSQLNGNAGTVSLSSASAGETNDQMMARMHPEQYAAQQKSAASNSSSGSTASQVGGC